MGMRIRSQNLQFGPQNTAIPRLKSVNRDFFFCRRRRRISFSIKFLGNKKPEGLKPFPVEALGLGISGFNRQIMKCRNATVAIRPDVRSR